MAAGEVDGVDLIHNSLYLVSVAWAAPNSPHMIDDVVLDLLRDGVRLRCNLHTCFLCGVCRIVEEACSHLTRHR